MADADDSESWFESALRHAELAAHQIARFKNPWWNPTWQDLVPSDPLPARAFTVGWGLRGRRSRPAAAARFVKRDSSACSPATPFDFGSGSGSGSGSGASTSGGEDGPSSQEKAAGKRRRVGDGADVTGAGCETKVVGIERAPLVFRTAAAKEIKRTGKKKTLTELQEEEKLLLEEKIQLQKEMELRRKSCEALQAENQRLKSQQINFQSERVTVKFTTASSSTHLILPDLNEPLSENLD